MLKRYVTALVLLLALPVVHALPITVTANNLRAEAFLDTLSNSDINPFVPVLNGAQGASAQVVEFLPNNGLRLAQSDIDLVFNGSSDPRGDANALFTLTQTYIDFTPSTGLFNRGTAGLSAEASDQFLAFTADTNAVFTLDAEYGLNDDLTGRIFLQVLLNDLTSGLVFNLSDDVRDTPGGAISLDASGKLTPGHDYELFVSASLQSRDGSDMIPAAPPGSPLFASASGTVNFNIMFVPEPGTMMLTAVGLVALRRRAARG